MHQILIYTDQGVDGGGLKQLIRSLKQELDPEAYLLQRVNAHQLVSENWEESAALLIIPGGRDVFYHRALDGAGTQRIRRYVENGGKYLGICAGAYFGCQAIEFEKGGALEVCAGRSLQFFPGVAKGPAYGLNKYSYENARGVEAAAITWENGTCSIYFNGGCLFDAHEVYPYVHTIGRYTDLEGQPAAILDIPVGKGRAILSGVHIEYSPSHLNPADPYLQKLIPIFEKSEEARRRVFRSLLARLGVDSRHKQSGFSDKSWRGANGSHVADAAMGVRVSTEKMKLPDTFSTEEVTQKSSGLQLKIKKRMTTQS